MKSFPIISLCLLAFMMSAAACGGGQDQSGATGEPEEGLTAEQLENGIGPITNVDLGPVDPELAARGQAAFELKCSACHKVDSRYVGPALGDVLSRRSPEFVMNMILNPEGMLAEHPEARKLLAEYMTPMANQNLTEAEARSILEYFRTLEAPAAPQGDELMPSSGSESD
jgi:mono/diheme cytochrome c family protein